MTDLQSLNASLRSALTHPEGREELLKAFYALATLVGRTLQALHQGLYQRRRKQSENITALNFWRHTSAAPIGKRATFAI